MTLVLRWRKAPRPVTTRWRGPDASLIATVAAEPETPVAAIIGPPGPGAPLLMRVAGAAIGGHRAVAVASDGMAYPVSPGDALADAVLGLSEGAAEAGAPVAIRGAGEITEAAWNWTPGPVWLGAGGLPTQTLPTSGAIVRLGTAGGATSLTVDVRLIARI